tara:strand:+ start:3969 stop:7796 length:3828 start_codon:yes stop_codon:yes gene_type:complete
MDDDDTLFDDDVTVESSLVDEPLLDDDTLFDDDEVTVTPTTMSESVSVLDDDTFFDEDDDIAVGDVSSAVAPVSVAKEEPVAPEGMEYVTELVTPDDGQAYVERVLQKKLSRFEKPEYTDPAFTFEDTGAALKQTGLDIYDTLSLVDRPLENAFGEEFTVKYVPNYLRPFVRVVGQSVDGLLVQPILGTAEDATRTALGGLNTALQFGKETIEGVGIAITRAVHQGITTENDAVNTISSLPGSPSTKAIVATIQEGLNLLDIEGTDIIKSSPKTAGRQLTRDVVLGLETAGILSTPSVAAKQALRPFAQAQKEINLAEAAAVRRIRVDEAKANEAVIIAKRKQAASKKVRENAKAADAEARETIAQIEEELLDGQSVSRETKSGRIAIDYDKAIDLGKKKTDELLEGELAEDTVLRDIVGTTNQLLHPILNPDKFEPVVAALLSMKQRFPDAFKKAKHLEGPYKGQKKTFGQQLKDLVIANTDEANSELLEVATEYGLTRDDLANMIMSGDRIAAQTLRAKGIALQKLRKGNVESSSSRLDAIQTKSQNEFDEAVKNLSTLTQNIKRVENMTLGLLTGTIGTAMRNLQSYITRSPLDGLIKVMEEGVIQANRRLKARKDKNFVGPPEAPRLTDEELIVLANRNPYAASLSALSNTYGGLRAVVNPAFAGNRKQMQEIIDYMVERGGKEYEQVFKKLYANIEELQMGFGRGEGKFGDTVLSGIEDLVQTLNAPNRWQEFHIRNGHYLGSIERQIQQEWGLDFIKTVNKSGITDFLNDSSRVRPKGAKSFKDIVTDAADEALEITYAAAPKSELGKTAINAFRKTPFSTLLAAFPRFSLKAMEYFGASFLGIPYVAARRIGTKGKASPTDTKLIAANIAGGLGVYTAYQYRMSEDAPGDYTKIKLPGGAELDTTYIIPIPQLLWLGEFFAQWTKGNGDVSDFINAGGGGKKFIELFTGTNFRAGQQLGTVVNNLIDELTNDFDSPRASNSFAKTAGDFVGSIAFRPFRPLTQVVELERTLGARSAAKRSFAVDPTIDSGDIFMSRLTKQFKDQGIFRTAEEESKFPRKVIPFKPEGTDVVSPALRLFGGMTITNPSSEVQEFLRKLNFGKQYMFRGQTGIGPVDDVITEYFNNLAIPQLIDAMDAYNVKIARATTKQEKKKAYQETRSVVKKWLTKTKNAVSSSDIKFKKGTVDEETGKRTIGTMNQEFVYALNEMKKLSSDDLKDGIRVYRDTFNIPVDQALDFSKPEVLLGIVKSSKEYSKRINEILNQAIPDIR